MHRNTYLNAPKLLEPELNLREHPRLFVAGVLAGTEGYLESSATGWLAGTNAARRVLGLEPLLPPETSMLGGLVRFPGDRQRRELPADERQLGASCPTLPKIKGEGKRERRTRTYQRGLEDFRGMARGGANG